MVTKFKPNRPLALIKYTQAAIKNIPKNNPDAAGLWGVVDVLGAAPALLRHVTHSVGFAPTAQTIVKAI